MSLSAFTDNVPGSARVLRKKKRRTLIAESGPRTQERHPLLDAAVEGGKNGYSHFPTATRHGGRRSRGGS